MRVTTRISGWCEKMTKRNFTIVLRKNDVQTTTDQRHAKSYHKNNTSIPAYTIKQAVRQIASTLKKGDTIDTIWVMTEQQASNGYIYDNHAFTNPEKIQKDVWQNPDFKNDIENLRKSVDSTSKMVFETCYGNEKTQKIIGGIFGISNVEYTPEFTWMSIKDAKLYVREQGGLLKGARYVDIHSEAVIKNEKLWKKTQAKPQPLKQPAVEPKWQPKKTVPIQTPGSGSLNLLQRLNQGTATASVGQSQSAVQSTRIGLQWLQGQAQRVQSQQQQMRVQQMKVQQQPVRTGIKIGVPGPVVKVTLPGQPPVTGPRDWSPGTGTTIGSGDSLMERARKQKEEEERKRRQAAFDAARDFKKPGVVDNIKTKYMPKPKREPLGQYGTVCSRVWEGPIGGPYQLTQHSHDQILIPRGVEVKKTRPSQWL